ncbi:MAG: riboflavin synthase [Pseudomonadota bacterium]
MFTGIITDMGTIASVDKTRGDARFAIYTDYDLEKVEIGASIACAGCCLTVVKKIDDMFFVDVSAETLSKTNLGSWSDGDKVNLEQSLKLGDELGGHIVSGHVDGLAKCISITKEGDSHRLVFETPEGFEKFVAPKGSVALDGISLTVNGVDGNQFGVNIIPHTWTHTTLGRLKEGDAVHFEADTIARYVARQLEQNT